MTSNFDSASNPFDCRRAPEEFSSRALLASLVLLFVIVFSNQAPHTHDNMLVVVALDMLAIAPLLYLTQWAKAHLFEIGNWYQRVVFGLLGLALVIHMTTVVLS